MVVYVQVDKKEVVNSCDLYDLYEGRCFRQYGRSSIEE